MAEDTTEVAAEAPLPTKPWWQSRTIIGAVVATVALGLNLTGVITLNDAEQTEIIDFAMQGVALGGMLYAFYGRLQAKTALTL